MMMSTEVLEVAGFRIHVERHGHHDGETVVMVNGALSTTASFRQAARFLQGHYNVVLFDPPYAGKSLALNPARRVVTKALS